MGSLPMGRGDRAALHGWAAMLAASLVGCASAPAGAGVSCAIPNGTYTYNATASGGPDCLSGTYTASVPPTVTVGDSGLVAGETCTRTKANGECHMTCVPAAVANAPTTMTTYTLTSGGYSGTTTSPVSGADGGVDYTCTYTFTATLN